MTTIDLIYFNAGGGHRAAALALEAVIAEQRRPWSIRLVNLVDLLDPTARFRRVTGAAPEDFYNKRLARGMTFGMAQELRLLQGVIRLGHAKLVAALRPHWLQREPDLVISLIPNFNRALCESLCDALPGVPSTVLTDMADYPAELLDRARPAAASGLRDPTRRTAGARPWVATPRASTRPRAC